MEQEKLDLLKVVSIMVDNAPVILEAILGILAGLIVIFSLIPGEQPEKALVGVARFFARFSLKKDWKFGNDAIKYPEVLKKPVQITTEVVDGSGKTVEVTNK